MARKVKVKFKTWGIYQGQTVGRKPGTNDAYYIRSIGGRISVRIDELDSLIVALLKVREITKG